MFSLANYVDEDARRAVQAFLVQRPRKGQVPRVWGYRHWTVVLLEPELNVTVRSWIPEYTEHANGVADLEVLADKEVGRRCTVLQKTSRVPDYCKERYYRQLQALVQTIFDNNALCI